jgi:hypothetical protein
MTLRAIASITLSSLSLACVGHDGARSSRRFRSPLATRSAHYLLKITGSQRDGPAPRLRSAARTAPRGRIRKRSAPSRWTLLPTTARLRAPDVRQGQWSITLGVLMMAQFVRRLHAMPHSNFVGSGSSREQDGRSMKGFGLVSSTSGSGPSAGPVCSGILSSLFGSRASRLQGGGTSKSDGFTFSDSRKKMRPGASGTCSASPTAKRVLTS